MSHFGYWYITIRFIFFQPPYLHKMFCFLNSWKQIELSFGRKNNGLMHVLEKRYQNETPLGYNFGSVQNGLISFAEENGNILT